MNDMNGQRARHTGTLRGHFYGQSIRPVACDIFRACIAVYRFAATEARPLDNLKRQKFLAIARLYGIDDIPPDPAMFAVLDFLGEARRETAVAVSARIRALLFAVSAARRGDPQYKDLLTRQATGKMLIASHALVDAFAMAPFVPGTLDIDVDAVHQIIAEPSGHALEL